MWVMLLVSLLALQLIIETEQCIMPKLPGIINKNYKSLYYKAANISGTYHFTIPAFTGVAQIKLKPQTTTSTKDLLDFDKYKMTGTVTTFAPYKIREVKAVGYFENLVFIGYIEFVDSDIWYFAHVATKEAFAKIGLFPTSILYQKADKEMLADPMNYSEDMVVDEQYVVANMHTRLFNPGKYCLVQVVCDYLLWNQLKFKADSHTFFRAENRLQSILDEAEIKTSEFYGNINFGAFGSGPQFKFFKPIIFKNYSSETVKKYNFLRPFPIVDIFDALGNFSLTKWNGHGLSILLTFRPHETHGIGNYGALCRHSIVEDGTEYFGNTIIINLAVGNRFATDAEIWFLFKHEIGHTMTSLHDTLGSDTLMHPGLVGNFEGTLSSESKINITRFLESLDIMAPGDRNGLGNTNCLVSHEYACARTGTCSTDDE